MTSFTENRLLFLVSDQFQWNWSETKNSFIWILENRLYPRKNAIFELKSLHPIFELWHEFSKKFLITYEKSKTAQNIETKIEKVIIFEILKLDFEFFCKESNYPL